MNFLQSLSIRTKLILASLIPLLGLLYYLQINLKNELSNKATAERVISDVNYISEISKVLHELQNERALVLAYASSNGTAGEGQLNAQWISTDKAIMAFEKIFDEQNADGKEVISFDSLAHIRRDINARKPIGPIDRHYSELKTSLLNAIGEISHAANYGNLKSSYDEHLLLLYTKEFMAQLRSELSIALTQVKFEGASYGVFAAIKGKHEIHLTRFKRIASPELRTFFDKRFHGSAVAQTYDIVNDVFYNPSLVNAKADLSTWLNVASRSIEALKEVEDFSTEIITRKAEAQLSDSIANVTRSIVIASLLIFLIVLLVVFTIKDIIGSVFSIKNAADKMARGDTNVMLNIKSRDEVGALAVSFNEMVKATATFSDVADVIGKGDYSPVIKIRGEGDTLGIALERMKSNLRKLSEDNSVRNWLLSGNSELNDIMRGEKDVKDLARDVIIQLATYLKAKIGIIYIKENDRLELAGSYAFHFRKDNNNVIKIGEGLVGQAALEKKPIVFSEVPENYIRINSGLGNATPKNILVYPFLYENEVKGVIELGAAQDFSTTDLQFLQMAGDNIAIAMQGAQSRSKMKELLEETQRQAEELETQQEELRQSNEGLEQKTILLEKSEAELKAQQEELQQTNEELEEKANMLEEQKERLGVAKMEIEHKARELEATSKYKSEFLANMSHELRTPLNSILILSQILAENKNNALPEKEVEFSRNIYSSGTDLLNLINEILDLSKVESGKMELDIEPVSFEEISSAMTSMFSEVAKSKLIDFTIKVNQRSIGRKALETDRQRLEQILRNLLSNAFKFTDRNGQVVLSIDRPSSGVTFKNMKLAEATEVVAFKVTDNGIGIPEHKQSIVFEAFQQADGSTKRKYGGTGLGLSICRELAQALGGEVQLQSDEGKGSTFTLYLPFRINAAQGAVNVSKFPERQVEKSYVEDNVQQFVPDSDIMDDRNDVNESDKVLLIIEDDAAFAKLLLDFVRARNYKGVVATQGNVGLSYARQYKPDAILLDLKLPVMDGMEVLQQLKADPQLRHLPVQIISAHDLRKEGISLGAFDFIKKPVTKERLQEAFDSIEEFINRKLKRLLIVEDNLQQNKAICELIGNGDVKCYSAFSGNDAMEMLHNEKFDCVIVDIGLPDMLGFELLRKIKADNTLNKIPIVVYTAKDLTKEESHVLSKLASTVVLKTVHSFERLLDETTLFLHRVESRLPKEKQNIIRKLHRTDEVLKNKNILVVDDDMRNIYSLTNALEEEGLNCLVAENGKAALQILREKSEVDLVLMDVMMPEMDGYEATREIRKLPEFDKLPIIALTAKAMKGDREKCLAAGMSDYISKPVNIAQLISLMRVWLYR
ncbi:MAG TPA: response regulator [Ohtaekwangia sp.]|nr:response regulator [Ohtaekwangia sp.]